MTVATLDLIMNQNTFTVEQRKAVMKYLRRKYYANQIDDLVYTRVKEHVVNRVKK